MRTHKILPAPNALNWPSSILRIFDLPVHDYESKYGVTFFHGEIGSPKKLGVDGEEPYEMSPGNIQARVAWAHYLKEWGGIEVTPYDVAITAGGSEPMYWSLPILFEPGRDEVLVPEPAYANLIAFFEMWKIKAVPIEMSYDSQFALTIRAIEKAITRKTRGIIITSPNNPTGQLIDPEVIDFIATTARIRGWKIVEDPAYRHVVFDGRKAKSFLQFPTLRQQVVSWESLSKWGYAGKRMGAFVCANKKIMAQFQKPMTLRLCTHRGSQREMIEILHDWRSITAAACSEFEKRRNTMASILDQAPDVVEYVNPMGGLYFLLKLRANAVKIASWLVHEHRYRHTKRGKLGSAVISPAIAFYLTRSSAAYKQARLSFASSDCSDIKNGMTYLIHGLRAYPY